VSLSSKRPLRLTLAGIAFLSITGGLSALEAVPPHLRDPSAAAAKSGPDRKASMKTGDSDLGARAAREAEARRRRWDRKMKAVGGSICRGC
jgi:hypothetical protein